MDWKKLLNSERRKDKAKVKTGDTSSKALGVEDRTELERDYDRILFSTPVRRLADKTQVFPLERNDSVRTRLTHSHEVSNLARSIGIALAFNDKVWGQDEQPRRDVPALLAAVGLAHDLGNPPFGHQGENAIQSWFKSKPELLNDNSLTCAMKEDFLRFEGNAQTLRLLTRLQLINDEFGLNLTYATLGALMKYPCPSDRVNKAVVARKKHGFFQSEKDIVEDVWASTGLGEGIRHPLTYVMEACDDIAYSVLDAEDAVKKGLVSFSDLIAYLQQHEQGDEAIKTVREKACTDHQKYRAELLSPAELNDISMLKFRVHAIAEMVRDVKKAFLDRKDEISHGKLDRELIEYSRSAALRDRLKDFDKKHAYVHRTVLEVELQGFNTITGLMDFLWDAIQNRKDVGDVKSKRSTPFASYAYNRISENYRRVFEDPRNPMPIRYKELQLLTDMISGMTDSFAMSLHKELKHYYAG